MITFRYVLQFIGVLTLGCAGAVCAGMAGAALASGWRMCGRCWRIVPIRAEMLARYPVDWKVRSRFVRLVRARNRCEWCGAENGKPHPVTGSKVVLTCAHVHDLRPEAAQLLNLASLCQRCHNRHDAKERAKGIKTRRLICRS